MECVHRFAYCFYGLDGSNWFLDDYLKKVKKNKDGLRGIFKVIGQVGLGLIVGVTMYFHSDITVQRKYANASPENRQNIEKNFAPPEKAVVSTVPFAKNNEFDYSKILFWMDDAQAQEWAWVVFIPVVIFIVTAVSNGANITDGIDGLAAGTSAIILSTLAFFAYLSGNIVFADYLNIMFLPNMGKQPYLQLQWWEQLLVFTGIILIRLRFLWEIREVLC